MKYIKNSRKGMTLIEIIISLALIAILSVTFLAVFTTGFSLIIKAGAKGKAQYKGQQAMEDRIAKNMDNAASDIPTVLDDVTVPPDSTYVLDITFGGTVVSASGKIKKIKYDNGKETAVYSTFIPDK